MRPSDRWMYWGSNCQRHGLTVGGYIHKGDLGDEQGGFGTRQFLAYDLNGVGGGGVAAPHKLYVEAQQFARLNGVLEDDLTQRHRYQAVTRKIQASGDVR